MENFIYLQHVFLYYKQKPIFYDLSLKLPLEKCICFLGSSGIGKSTLLHLIANIPTGADTNTFQALISTSDKKPLKNRIAYMTQQDRLLPWLNVLDNVLIGYRLRGETNQLPKLKFQAIDLLHKVGLEKNDIYKKPQVLSGGMRQRAAIVRTFIENRPIVLMDEPFSSLDAITRIKLQDLAAELLQNRSVFFVTHDPLEALRLSDVIYIMSGSPAKLSNPIMPEGTIPRDIRDPNVLMLQGQLLNELMRTHIGNKTI